MQVTLSGKFAHVIGLPVNLTQRFVTLEFLARPKDYKNLKAELASTLKVHPFYDPAYIDPQMVGDADTVLEARTIEWHIDPVTHASF